MVERRGSVDRVSYPVQMVGDVTGDGDAETQGEESRKEVFRCTQSKTSFYIEGRGSALQSSRGLMAQLTSKVPNVMWQINVVYGMRCITNRKRIHLSIR